MKLRSVIRLFRAVNNGSPRDRNFPGGAADPVISMDLPRDHLQFQFQLFLLKRTADQKVTVLFPRAGCLASPAQRESRAPAGKVDAQIIVAFSGADPNQAVARIIGMNSEMDQLSGRFGIQFRFREQVDLYLPAPDRILVCDQ